MKPKTKNGNLRKTLKSTKVLLKKNQNKINPQQQCEDKNANHPPETLVTQSCLVVN